MARPFKSGPKMDKDLRIPVTEEQRDLVNRAVEIVGSDMAGWARSLLLPAAQEIVDKEIRKAARRK